MAEIVVDEEVGAVPERLRVYIIIYYIIMYYILIIYDAPRAAARAVGRACHRYTRVHHCISYHIITSLPSITYSSLHIIRTPKLHPTPGRPSPPVARAPPCGRSRRNRAHARRPKRACNNIVKLRAMLCTMAC